MLHHHTDEVIVEKLLILSQHITVNVLFFHDDRSDHEVEGSNRLAKRIPNVVVALAELELSSLAGWSADTLDFSIDDCGLRVIMEHNHCDHKYW